ncbi:MAG: hypothetical protein CTY12_01480 [Methylotenera sp.]|nr:MAG: hypothetical protein CTY12_01480 [Methylotenera sp.]
MNELELQRLHDTTALILENSPWVSVKNKVVPLLYMMLGEVWCGDHSQQYVYICDSRLDARDVCGQFVELLDTEDEAYIQTHHFTSDPIVVVPRTGQTFHFIPYTKALIEEYWNEAVCDRAYINTGELTSKQLSHLHLDIITIGADFI